MAQQYYYLLSSLPELLFQDNSNSFDFLHYKEYILEHIDSSDAKWIDQLLYTIDNRNVISYLYKTGAKWEAGGTYTPETWQDALSKPDGLPKYLQLFFKEWGKQGEDAQEKLSLSSELSQLDAERLLLKYFYEEAEQSKNKFTAAWYTFDRELRNLQAAYAAQRLGISFDEHLTGHDDLTEIMLQNKTKGLGLTRERDYLPQLLSILQIENLLERERKLDLFRWQQVDEMTTFDYFSMDAILAFVQKAQILDRWLKLNPESGKQQFRKLVEALKGSYQL